MTNLEELREFHELLRSEISPTSTKIGNVYFLQKDSLSSDLVVVFEVLNFVNWAKGSSNEDSYFKTELNHDLSFVPLLEYTKTKKKSMIKRVDSYLTIKSLHDANIPKILITSNNSIYRRYVIDNDTSSITMLVHNTLPITDVKIKDSYYRWTIKNTKSNQDQITFKYVLYKLPKDELNMFMNNKKEGTKDTSSEDDNSLLITAINRSLLIDLNSNSSLNHPSNIKLGQLIYNLKYKNKLVTTFLLINNQNSSPNINSHDKNHTRSHRLNNEDILNTAMIFKFIQDSKLSNKGNMKQAKYSGEMGIKVAF